MKVPCVQCHQPFEDHQTLQLGQPPVCPSCQAAQAAAPPAPAAETPIRETVRLDDRPVEVQLKEFRE